MGIRPYIHGFVGGKACLLSMKVVEMEGCGWNNSTDILAVDVVVAVVDEGTFKFSNL